MKKFIPETAFTIATIVFGIAVHLNLYWLAFAATIAFYVIAYFVARKAVNNR